MDVFDNIALRCAGLLNIWDTNRGKTHLIIPVIIIIIISVTARRSLVTGSVDVADG